MADLEEIMRGLQIERECVSRDCDRDCGKCDLAQDKGWLLSVYDGALELLKEQEAVECINNHGILLCGRCKNIIGYDDGYGRSYKGKFCCECGRPVKWDDI